MSAGFAQAAPGHCGFEDGGVVVGNVFEVAGHFNESGCYGVDADFLGGQFHGEVASEGGDCTFVAA